MLGGAGGGTVAFLVLLVDRVDLLEYVQARGPEPDKVLQRNGINTIYVCICVGIYLHMRVCIYLQLGQDTSCSYRRRIDLM